MLVRMLAVALEHAKGDPKQLLAAAEIDDAALDDIHARVPLVDIKRLINAALTISGDPALGLHMGINVSRNTFDVVGHLVEDSSTLRHALQVAVKYQRIMTRIARMEVSEDGQLAIISLVFPDPVEPEAQVAAEFAMTALLNLVRLFMGSEVLPKQAAFAYPAPPHQQEYARIFGGREQFAQPFTGLVLERAWLDRGKPGGARELFEYLQTRADLLLSKADVAISAAERVRSWLSSRLSDERPTIDSIARDLGTSERTLRRRLQSENVQFSELVDETYADHAKTMLADPQRTIEQTAYALGFSTPSGFARAFRRWTGSAPSEFRRLERVSLGLSLRSHRGFVPQSKSHGTQLAGPDDDA